MAQESESCIACSEAITNPLCLTCIEEEMEVWLAGIKPSLIPILRGVTMPFSSYDHGTTKCINCGSRMSVCSHCYANEMLAWIKDVLPEYSDEFVERFNFELSVPCKF